MRAPATPSALLERIRAAADARDWERLRALCHPEARLVLRMSEGTALSVDEALEVLKADAEAMAYEPTHYYVDDIDERAVIAVGSVLTARDSRPKHLCWLLTFVGGRLYRQALFPSLVEAQDAYRELGLELGAPSDVPGPTS